MQVLEFESPNVSDSLMAYGTGLYSSNGLLCVELFGESQRSLWLWNLAIRKVHQVPKSLNKYEGESFSVGFGFSSIVNDYKIVKLFMSDFLVARVEVYALRTGLWTNVEPGNLEVVCVSHPGAFNCNGAIFWVGMKEGVEEGRKIVSFDIGMELVFGVEYPFGGEPENYEGNVVLCNVTTDEFNMFSIPKWRFYGQNFDYVESLALLDNIHI
ncbi:F-box/kelch-repeat protein At3g06240-like [Neltuma alba]|uniref:F-box/kelch-repeat protein At3g06240-like n=1 Tax=Neltuma alba TaxID=207710 RepID=UPI0010A2C101|nr:F-box/kelch-repeat protein At3g06240-like [Prosopis alba]